ncbi:MAG: hypothetical protein O3A02_01235 [bacterium]|nr:hypothetical protein [bacterium]
MTGWTRPAVALGAWCATLLLVSEHGVVLGAYQVLPWAFAVGVTGGMLGSWAGVVTGGVAGTLVAFGIDPTGYEPVTWRSVVATGTLLLPLLLMGIGVASAVGVQLHAQVDLHRDAFDRAQYDVLTGAFNRRSFERRLDE